MAKVTNPVQTTTPVAPAMAPAPNGKKPVEPKDVKFRRRANLLVPQALKRLRHVTALANRAQYHYTEEQAGKIVAVLTQALELLKMAYSGQKVPEAGFHL